MGEPTRFEFGDVAVDVVGRAVVSGGRPVTLQRKPFDLLVHLLRNRDRVVAKEEIYRELWPDEFVGDASLSMSIAKIRKAIGDSPGAPAVIETVYGVGYRVIADVRSDAPADDFGMRNRADRHPPAKHVVGRELELETLWTAWEQAVAGSRSAVLVVGEAGIGKTALVDAFCEMMSAASPPLVLRGECLDLRTCEEPFQPLLDAWSVLCRRDGAALAVDILRRFAPAWLLQLQGVVDATERARLQTEARQSNPAKLLRTHGEALVALADDRPVVLIVEDVHWADAATLDALTRLVRDRSPARVLALLTSRPVVGKSANPGTLLVDAIGRGGAGRVVGLGRLTANSIDAFLRAHGASTAATGSTCSALYDRTRGHPLFLAAAARHLAQGGDVHEVPPDLREFLHAQLDALDPDRARLVQVAGLIGTEFEAALVAAVVEQTLAEVEESLLSIARDRRILDVAGDVSWPDGTECRMFRFAHAYNGQTAVECAARTRLPGWNGLIAQRLVSAHPAGMPGSVAMRAARHFARARELPAALDAWQRAIAVAQEECAHERVRTAAEHALEVLEAVPRDADRDRREIALRLALGRALVVTDGFPADSVLANCDRLLATAQSQSDLLAQLTALLILSAAHQVRGEVRRAIERAEEMAVLVAGTPEVLRIAVQAWLGFLYVLSGDFGRARSRLEPVRTICVADMLRATGFDLWVDPDVVFAAYHAIALLMMGEPDAARERDGAALTRAEAIGHSYSRVTAWLVHANYLLVLGDIGEFRRYARDVAALAEREGVMGAANNLRAYRHAADVLETPSRAGAQVLRDSLAAAERNGERLEGVPMRVVLARVYAQLGDDRAGVEILDEALAFIEASGERIAEAEVRRLRALALRATDPAAARRELDRALVCAREQGARFIELRLAADRVEITRDRRARAKAREELREVYEQFQEGFDLPDFVRAKALLGRIVRTSWD